MERILTEYFQAFGKAQADVRAYFDHWEEVTYSEATAQAYRSQWQGPLVVPAITDNQEHRIYRWSELFIPDQAVGKGRALLQKAGQAAQGHPSSEKRVEFLCMGLHDYELTRVASRAFRAHQQGGDVNDYLKALRRLDQHRAAIETHNVANMGYLRWKEFLWDRKALSNPPSKER